MEQRYTCPTIWEEIIVAILCIYRDRAIFLLFYDNKDTESESREMEIDVAGPIFTQKNIKGSVGQ